MESGYKVAGIDVHKKMLAVVVTDVAALGAYEFEHRKFGASAGELEALADWLSQQGVREAVMESTAQYWRPVWLGLERVCQLHLAQAQSNKAPKGRKRDFADAERLVRRHVAGELILSFVPDEEQRLWRTLTRSKHQLTRDRVRLRNQMETFLEDSRIKLSSYLSDLLGVSGRRMLGALAQGVTDAAQIAALTSSPAWSQWLTNGNVWYSPSGTPIGIGTASPNTPLQVGAGVPFAGGFQLATISSSQGLLAQTSGIWAAVAYNSSSGNEVDIAGPGSSFGLIVKSGNVGIGTSSPTYPPSVNGTVQAKEVLVNAAWSDYVFQPDYHLLPLSDVAAFIKENHHLPGIPTEAEVKEKGVSLGDMQSKMLAKVEELTLHMIQADERNTRLAQQNRDLQQRIAKLEHDTVNSGGENR